ncbi:hypothetical protein HZI30_05505 [Serratia fonticola]|uniref:hypothetical protein n=1 Tax=Serratia fonticola TaxID=47917 RepID=UPI0015C5B829|nr:hypothetical protein [Serratia fonticola]NXZ86392.1 hypothetical protein [Serratia fonticola]
MDMADYVFYGFVAVLVMIVYALLGILKTLLSIDKKLGDHEHSDAIMDLKDEIAGVRQVLEEIRYTTDLIETYALPTPEQRETIDSIRVDQEIDEMISSKKN